MNTNLKVIVCKSFLSRLKGFMFTNKINKILCFPNCNSIHTFFMFKSIDIIMTDKNHKVLYTYYSFKPWKIILPKKDVYYTYELPKNTIKIKVGEFLKKN